MNRTDAWLLHISNGLVMITGLLYAWMAYFCKSDDPYAIVGHPWQPHVQHAHIWFAPLLVLMLGHLWNRHAEPHLKRETKKRRNSGLSMLLIGLPMIFSGYAIMTAIEPIWRQTWVTVHLTTSAIWIAAYLAHLRDKWIRKKKTM